MNIKDGVMFLTLVLIVSVIFSFLALADSWTPPPAYATPGAYVSILTFNLSNNGTGGNILNNITINLTFNSTVPANNVTITNVTLINATTGNVIAFNSSGIFPLLLNITNGEPINNATPDGVNYTINVTLNISSSHNLTFGINVTEISGGENITYSPLPYVSSLKTIDRYTAITFVEATTPNASYLNQAWISVNASTIGLEEGVGTKNITIYLYNASGLVNNTSDTTGAGSLFVNFTSNTGSSTPLLEGIYYFNATTYDNPSDNGINNYNYTPTRWVVLDRTAPVVDISAPTANGVYGSSTVDLTFTATDNIDTTLSCNMTLDGTSSVIGTVTNGTTTTTSMTGLAAGSHSVFVTCADSTGNSATSSSVTFYVRDYYVASVSFEPSTPYSISTTTATVTIYAGAPSERLFVSATEGGSLLAYNYVTPSSVGLTSVTLSFPAGTFGVGTHTLVFNVYNTSLTEIDNTNNAYTTTLSVASLVTRSITSVSSASSTSAAATTNKVASGQTVSYDLSKAINLTINAVDVVFASALTGVTINAMNIAAPPETAPKPSGIIYGYVKVEKTGVTDKDISSATIHVKVTKKWIIDNNIDPDKVTVLRLENNTWSKLTTTKASEDDSYVYYDVTSPGLSIFVVTGEIKTAAPEAPQAPAEKPEEKVTPSTPTDYTWLIIIVVIIIIAGAGYYLYSQGYLGKKK